MELSCTVIENANVNCFGKQFGSFINIPVTYDPFLNSHPKRNESLCPYKDVSPDVHRSLFVNIQLEATELINRLQDELNYIHTVTEYAVIKWSCHCNDMDKC